MIFRKLSLTSSIRSPLVTLPDTAGQRLTFRYAFGHSAASTNADWLRVEIVRGDGTRTRVFQATGAAVDRDAAWLTGTVTLDAWAGTAVRIRISASDGANGNLVEAAVDDVRVTRP